MHFPRSIAAIVLGGSVAFACSEPRSPAGESIATGASPHDTGGALASGGASSSGLAGSGPSSGSASPGWGGSLSGSGGQPALDCASRSDLILCEDFETTDVGQVPSGWSPQGDVVVTDQVARGTRALHIGVANNGPRRISISPNALGTHWGRIRYRVHTPTPAAFAHSTLVELAGEGPNLGTAWYRVVDTVQNAERKHQFLFNVQPAASGEFGKGSSYDWEFKDEWQCAEWSVSGEAQAYRFFLNGSEIPSIGINNGSGNFGSGSDRTHLPMTFTNLSIGWYNYQSAPPGFEVWIDDVAIGVSRVGCD